MNKHRFPYRSSITRFLILSILAAVASLTNSAATDELNARPNILFIMSDDHTYQAIGAYGSRLAKLNPTPNIDRLAENGMRFDRVFCTNSICTPSRASILTGQYSQKNGVTNLGGRLTPDQQLLPIELKKAGYQTAIIGKWHLKEEPASFDYYCVLDRQGQYFNPLFRTRGDKPWPQNSLKKMGLHSSDAITDLSLEWLESKRDKSKPFCLLHHFKAPHDMFNNAKRYNTYLDDVKIPEPFNLFDPPSGSIATKGMGSGVGRTHSPWGLAKRLNIPDDLDDREYAKAGYQTYLKRYLRCVKGVDDNVKRLFDYLDNSGELQNTIIIYTGDQGFFLGEHDLMDKRWMYEEAMRMPFIIHWPKVINKGAVNDWLINNTDFAPTLLEIAGRPSPSSMQGKSFAAALSGKDKPGDWRKFTYYRYWMHMAHNLAVPAHFGIRSDRYKLIFFYGYDEEGSKNNRTPPAWEFYDLKTDPFEMKNLYADTDHQDLIAEMKSELMKERERLEETDIKRPAINKIIRDNWSK